MKMNYKNRCFCTAKDCEHKGCPDLLTKSVKEMAGLLGMEIVTKERCKHYRKEKPLKYIINNDSLFTRNIWGSM